MDESHVKSIIRSLLTSSPQDCTIKQLQRDYYEMIGMRIPFHKLGYTSVEHFLKSITDTCDVRGNGEFALVRPVITKKVAHINDLVTKQKIASKKSGYRPQRRPRFDPSRGQNYPRQPFAPQIYPSGYRNFNRLESAPLVPPSQTDNVPKLMDLKISTPSLTEYEISNSHCSNSNTLSFNSSIESVKVNPQVMSQPAPEKPLNMLTCEALEPKLQKTRITESIRRAITDCNKNDIAKKHREKINSRKPEEAIDKPEMYSKNDNIVVLENNLPIESRIPTRVQENLKILIGKHPEGIWCLDLPKIYRESFRRELTIGNYGYTSLMVMCLDLKHIFHAVRQDYGDYMLYDRDKPLPKTVLNKEYTMKSYVINSGMKSSSYVIGNERSAHPRKTDWEDFVDCIPRDILAMGEVIPRQFLDESCQEDSVIDIVIVETYDPSKFWFYMADSQLDTLMNEMQDFYRQSDIVKRYLVPSMLLQEGLYCVQIIFGEYHRAVIVDVLPDLPGHVKLLYIDYGTLTRAPSEGICFLHRRFSTLPAQAIRGRLANVAPPEESVSWSKETNDRLRQIITGREHRAKICDVDRRQLFASVFLADVTEDDPAKYFYVNEELVKEGRAVWVEQERKPLPLLPNATCQVKQIHLYPTFFELEYGMAPNVNAMLTLDNMKVPLSFAYPQYFKLNNEKSNDAASMEAAEEDHVKKVVANRVERCRVKFNIDKYEESAKIDWNVFGDCKDGVKTLTKYYGQTLDDSDEDNCFCDVDEAETTVKDKQDDTPLAERPAVSLDEEIPSIVQDSIEIREEPFENDLNVVETKLETIAEELLIESSDVEVESLLNHEEIKLGELQEIAAYNFKVEDSSSAALEDKSIKRVESSTVEVEGIKVENEEHIMKKIEDEDSKENIKEENESNDEEKIIVECKQEKMLPESKKPVEMDDMHVSSDSDSNVTVRHLLQDLKFFEHDSDSSGDLDQNEALEILRPPSLKSVSFSARTPPRIPSTTCSFRSSAKVENVASNGRTSRMNDVMRKINASNPFKSESASSFETWHANNPFKRHLETNKPNECISSKEKVDTWISSQQFDRGSGSSSENNCETERGNISAGTQTSFEVVQPFRPPVHIFPMPVMPIPVVCPRWPPGFFPNRFRQPAPAPGFVPAWYPPQCFRPNGEFRIPQVDGVAASGSEGDVRKTPPVEKKGSWWDWIEEKSKSEDGKDSEKDSYEKNGLEEDVPNKTLSDLSLRFADVDSIPEFVPKKQTSVFENRDIEAIREFVPKNVNY